jgi:hypothetical protein
MKDFSKKRDVDDNDLNVSSKIIYQTNTENDKQNLEMLNPSLENFLNQLDKEDITFPAKNNMASFKQDIFAIIAAKLNDMNEIIRFTRKDILKDFLANREALFLRLSKLEGERVTNLMELVLSYCDSLRDAEINIIISDPEFIQDLLNFQASQGVEQPFSSEEIVGMTGSIETAIFEELASMYKLSLYVRVQESGDLIIISQNHEEFEDNILFVARMGEYLFRIFPDEDDLIGVGIRRENFCSYDSLALTNSSIGDYEQNSNDSNKDVSFIKNEGVSTFRNRLNIIIESPYSDGYHHFVNLDLDEEPNNYQQDLPVLPGDSDPAVTDFILSLMVFAVFYGIVQIVELDNGGHYC